MRKFIPFILLFLLSGCNQPHIPEKLLSDIDSIILKWVPDQRENICHVDLLPEGNKTIIIKGETNLAEARSEIIRYISGAGYDYLDSLTLLPDTLGNSGIWGLVSLSVCNIKSTPSHSSELVSQAVMGTPLKILKEKGSWYLIQTPDYYIGWVNSSGISVLNSQEFNNWRGSDRVIFTGKSGDILSEPGSGRVVSDIVSGSVACELDIKNNYYHIILPDGREGYLKVADCEEFNRWSSTVSPDTERLIRFSESLTGSPYLWGGTSVKAMDCSGFMKNIYFMGGIILARDASLQFLHGIPVGCSTTLDSLQKGDLIFFGYYRDGKKRITHVGMYIGDTQVIHCSGMVRVSSLDPTRTNYSEYLYKGMMGARRIIGSDYSRGAERIAGHPWYIINK